MTSEFQAIAEDMAQYLRTLQGVSQVRPPVPPAKRATSRRRPPMPSFLAPQDAAFEISFTYKNEARTFRYYLDALDDRRAVSQTLRIHTNGELMVRVPDDYGRVVPNDIYYVNRIDSVTGTPAPRR